MHLGLVGVAGLANGGDSHSLRQRLFCSVFVAETGRYGDEQFGFSYRA